MKKFLFLFLIPFVSSNFVNAQIENEIKSFVDSTEFVVNNGRKLIIQKLNTKDYAKIKEIYYFLINETLNSKYKAFTYTEKLYINTLTKDWNALVDLFINYKSEISYYVFPNLYPIWTILYENIASQADSLTISLKSSTLNTEDKEIIEIYLYLLKSREVDEEYSMKLKKYLESFKNSKYEMFIKNYLPRARVKGAMAFSFGSGIILPTGKIKSDYRTNAMFNMSLDFNVERIFTTIFFDGGALFLKNPFQTKLNGDSIYFSKNDRFSYINGGLKGGYFLIRNNRLNISPFISITGLKIESTLYKTEREGDEYQVVNSFCYGVGLHSELKIKEFKYPSLYGPPMNSYISLKLEGGYNIIAKHRNNYSGNVPYINLALVWGLGDF